MRDLSLEKELTLNRGTYTMKLGMKFSQADAEPLKS